MKHTHHSTHVRQSGTQMALLYGTLALIGVMIVLAIAAPQIKAAYSGIDTLVRVFGG